jgi:small subunit ribosomal protein S9
VPDMVEYRATGRRKTAIARVFLRPGEGTVTMNRRALEDYVPSKVLQAELQQPLVATGTTGKFDILVLLRGGGLHGQVGAARLGIARALLAFDPELRVTLRRGDFLTRDSRAKERKKYGQKGARKRFQFSKR